MFISKYKASYLLLGEEWVQKRIYSRLCLQEASNLTLEMNNPTVLLGKGEITFTQWWRDSLQSLH